MLTAEQKTQLINLIDGEVQYLNETPEACMFSNVKEAEAIASAVEALPVGPLHIVVWTDDGQPNAQAYATRAAAERDFDHFAGMAIIESTVQP